VSIYGGTSLVRTLFDLQTNLQQHSRLERFNYCCTHQLTLVLVLVTMCVDTPVAGVQSILKLQDDWEKNCVRRCTKENHRKRYELAEEGQKSAV
jgi:hypothetical protein